MLHLPRKKPIHGPAKVSTAPQRECISEKASVSCETSRPGNGRNHLPAIAGTILAKVEQGWKVRELPCNPVGYLRSRTRPFTTTVRISSITHAVWGKKLSSHAPQATEPYKAQAKKWRSNPPDHGRHTSLKRRLKAKDLRKVFATLGSTLLSCTLSTPFHCLVSRTPLLAPLSRLSQASFRIQFNGVGDQGVPCRDPPKKEKAKCNNLTNLDWTGHAASDCDRKGSISAKEYGRTCYEPSVLQACCCIHHQT